MSPERILIPLKHALWDSWRLPLAVVFVVLLLVGTLILRGQRTNEHDRTLCQIITAFVVSGDLALDDPDSASSRILTAAERQQAHKTNIEFVRKLDSVCDTTDISRVMEARVK